MPTSDSYHDYLISRLKDPNYAALYLETHFELDEDEDIDPELLRLGLSNVAAALSEGKMTSEEAKQHLEKLDELLSQKGSYVIYNLGVWLNALGLKLTVTVAEKEKDNVENSVIASEVTA
ncbi:DNA-binding protein [Argonema galeatum]|uniref:helix-turn-helix domain-containing transcriptional regulator n=1 Tax=Argonema galeatum TaxID=2942762 RepID=UPI0020119253|nr:transcriptional regulator [Argonema galeatum]MCL1463016.1 transcriptional regulator [Argonema galeatum A003/A1]